jgi:hypothetical protein
MAQLLKEEVSMGAVKLFPERKFDRLQWYTAPARGRRDLAPGDEF